MVRSVVKSLRCLQSIVVGLLLAGGVVFAPSGCAKGATSPGEPDLSTRNVCPDNPQFCQDGTCCGTECLDTRVNARNCGACGVECQAGTVCSGGKCGCLPTGTACGTGQSCCGNIGCKSLASDVKNCGSCGKACGDGATCENGVCLCGTVACASGQVCCNGACAASCANLPDMATAPCVCASGCPLSHLCVGPNCCVEQVLLGGSCMPDPTCTQSMP